MKIRFLILGLLLWTSPAFAQSDMVDIRTAVVWNSPGDVASWPATTSITSLTMRPSSAPEPGLSFAFSARSTWPDYTPPGWDGPLQYTVWAGVKINGVWNISGIIQMWRERAATGAPLLTDFARNWVYDGRWGAMQGYQPSIGEAYMIRPGAGYMAMRGGFNKTTYAEFVKAMRELKAQGMQQLVIDLLAGSLGFNASQLAAVHADSHDCGFLQTLGDPSFLGFRRLEAHAHGQFSASRLGHDNVTVHPDALVIVNIGSHLHVGQRINQRSP